MSITTPSKQDLYDPTPKGMSPTSFHFAYKYGNLMMTYNKTGKTLNLKPDSPRTKEAILQLGLEPLFFLKK